MILKVSWDKFLLTFLEAVPDSDKFYENTVAENYLIIHAHQRNKYIDQCSARMIAYTIYCANMETEKRVSLQEFYPLAFDSKEETEDPEAFYLRMSEQIAEQRKNEGY